MAEWFKAAVLKTKIDFNYCPGNGLNISKSVNSCSLKVLFKAIMWLESALFISPVFSDILINGKSRIYIVGCREKIRGQIPIRCTACS